MGNEVSQSVKLRNGKSVSKEIDFLKEIHQLKFMQFYDFLSKEILMELLAATRQQNRGSE